MEKREDRLALVLLDERGTRGRVRGVPPSPRNVGTRGRRRDTWERRTSADMPRGGMARFETTDDGEVEWHAAKRAGETTVARRLVEPASRAFVGVNVRSDVLKVLKPL